MSTLRQTVGLTFLCLFKYIRENAMNKYLKIGLITLAGAAAGLLYHELWGCRSGCPLQSNWYVTTGYGAIAGLILSLPSGKFPGKKKGREENDQ